MATAQSSIQKTPGVCGGVATIADTRIPVWVLEQCRQLGMSVKEILEDYPTLQPADILAAWEYAAVHSSEIREQIRENRDA
jgi:uncharacterized protein (DUF433 family)